MGPQYGVKKKGILAVVMGPRWGAPSLSVSPSVCLPPFPPSSISISICLHFLCLSLYLLSFYLFVSLSISVSRRRERGGRGGEDGMGGAPLAREKGN